MKKILYFVVVVGVLFALSAAPAAAQSSPASVFGQNLELTVKQGDSFTKIVEELSNLYGFDLVYRGGKPQQDLPLEAQEAKGSLSNVLQQLCHAAGHTVYCNVDDRNNSLAIGTGLRTPQNEKAAEQKPETEPEVAPDPTPPSAAASYDPTYPSIPLTLHPSPLITGGRYFGGTRSQRYYYNRLYSDQYYQGSLGSWEYQDWRAAIASGEYGLIGFNCERGFCDDVLFYLDGCEVGTVTQANNVHDGKIPISRGQHRITLAKVIDHQVVGVHINTNVGSQAISQALGGQKFLNIRVSKERFDPKVWGNAETGWAPPAAPACGR